MHEADLTVLEGVTNYTKQDSETASIHSLDKIVIHPNYDRTTLDFDVGFLFLKNRISFIPTAKPIALAPVSERPKHGDILLATGWGRTEVGEVNCASKIIALSP